MKKTDIRPITPNKMLLDIKKNISRHLYKNKGLKSAAESRDGFLNQECRVFFDIF